MHTPSPHHASTAAAAPTRWPYPIRLLMAAALGMGVALFAIDLVGPMPKHPATLAAAALLGATLALIPSILGGLTLAERWCLSPLAEMGLCILSGLAGVALGGWAASLAAQQAPVLLQESSAVLWMGAAMGAATGAGAVGLHAWRKAQGKS